MTPGSLGFLRAWALGACILGLNPAAATNVSRDANTTEYNTQTAITTVLEMLEEMKTKSQQLQQEADVAYAEVVQVCASEETARTNQLDEMGRQVELMQANIASLELEINSIGEDIVTADRDYTNSTAWLKHLREERQVQEAQYMNDLEEFSAAIQATERAREILAEQEAAAATTTRPPLVVALSQVAGLAAHTNKGARPSAAEHASLMQYTPIGSSIAKDEHIFDEFDSLSTATTNYVSQTGNVDALLESLLTTFRSRKEELINTEKSNLDSFKQLEATLVAQIASDRELGANSRRTIEERRQDLATEKQQLEEVFENRNSTEVYLGELRTTCSDKEQEHQTVSALRADEIAAVDNAVAIITGFGSTPTSLLRVNATLNGTRTLSPHGQRNAEGESMEADKVVGFLRLSAQRLQSQPLQAFVAKLGSLVAVSSTDASALRGTAEDPLAKVKVMISDLIIRLQQQASDESSHKAWCDAELAKNEAAQSGAQGNIDKHSAEIERLTGDMDMVAMQNATATAELNASREAAAAFEEQRAAEKLSNEAILEDAQTAIQALEAAISLLEEYYGNVSEVLGLVHTNTQVQHSLKTSSRSMNATNETSPLKLPDELTRKSVEAPSPQGGKSVLALLEVIRDRYTHIEQEVTAAEQAAQQDEVQTLRDHAVMVASMESDITFYTQQFESYSAEKSATVEALNASQQALADAEATYESLKPPCLNVETYEERALWREQEIEALREAEQMLNDFIAEYGALTGLISVRAIKQEHGKDLHRPKNMSQLEERVLKEEVNMTQLRTTKLDIPGLLNSSLFSNSRLARLVEDKRLLISMNASQNVNLSEAPTIVRDLLIEIRDEVQAQLTADTTTFNDLQAWCTSSKAQLNQQIEDGNTRDQELVNTISTSAYDMESARTHLGHLQQELSHTQDSLRERSAIRMRQLDEFRQSEKELLQSIVTLRNAIVVLESHFNRTAANARNLTAEREELEAEKARLEEAGGEAANATTLVGIAAQVAKVLKSAATHGLSTAATSLEASDVLQQFVSTPEASWTAPNRRMMLAETHRSSETPASGEVVLGVLRQLLVTFQNDLSSENTNEETAVNEFNSLEESLLNEISVLETSIENKQTQLVEATRLNAQAKEELASVREALTQDRAALSAVHQECLDDEAEFARRNTTRSEEIATLNSAIQTLNESIVATEAASGAATGGTFMLHGGRTVFRPEHGFANFHMPRILPIKRSPQSAHGTAKQKPPSPPARPESIIKGYIASARKMRSPVTSGRRLTMLSYSANASSKERAMAKLLSNWHHTDAALAALTAQVDEAERTGRALEVFTPLTLEAIKPVLTAISSLRTTLQAEKQLEIKMRDTCIGENNTANLDLEKRINEEHHKQAEIEGYEATINSSKAEIVALADQIEIMNNSLNVSREQRSTERLQLQESVQQQREYVKILRTAEQLLALYYDTEEFPTSLLQLQQEPPGPSDGNSTLNGTVVNRSSLPWKPRFAHPLEPHGGGMGVVAIIQILIEQTESTIKALEAGEEQSMDAYAAGVTETTQSMEAMRTQIIVLQQRIGDANFRLQEAKTALTNAEAATQEVRDFLTVVETKCTYVVENFDDNQAARQAEIDNLFQARVVLEGMVEQASTALLSITAQGSRNTAEAAPHARRKMRKGLRGILAM